MKNSQFLAGIVIAIVLAKLDPSIGNVGGILKPEITVKYIAVSVIFLNSGLTLPTEDLTGAILRWDLHLYIQGFTFVVFPIIVYCLVTVLQYTFLNEALLEGMTILSTMPPPVSSAIILTRTVGGNEAAAVFNSAFGSMLGIFVTPFLILILMGSSEVEIPTEKIFQQLFMTVVVPLVIGQVIRNYNYRWLMRQHIPFGTIGQCLILYIIYTTFCATFSRTDFQLDTFSLVVVVLLMFCLQVSIKAILLMSSRHIFGYSAQDAIAIMYVGTHKNLTLVFLLQLCFMAFLLFTSSSSLFNFDPRDCIAVTYCGTHKSLTLGIPVIDIIFEGNPNISFLSIPLLIYNPMQIVFGGMSIPIFKTWLQKELRKRRAKKWIINTRRKDLETKSLGALKSCFLCAEHFETCWFSQTATKRLRLLKDAVPTIFNIPNPPPRITASRPPPKGRLLPEIPVLSVPASLSCSSVDEIQSSSPAFSHTSHGSIDKMHTPSSRVHDTNKQLHVSDSLSRSSLLAVTVKSEPELELATSSNDSGWVSSDLPGPDINVKQELNSSLDDDAWISSSGVHDIDKQLHVSDSLSKTSSLSTDTVKSELELDTSSNDGGWVSSDLPGPDFNVKRELNSSSDNDEWISSDSETSGSNDSLNFSSTCEVSEIPSNPTLETDDQVIIEWELCDNANQGEPSLQITTLPDFDQKHGVLVDTSHFEPVDYFSLFFPPSAISLIVSETNKYATRKELTKETWEDTNCEEIRAYLGLLIAMGLHPLSAVADHWAEKNWILSPASFGQVISRNRFILLDKFVHFSSKEDVPNGSKVNHNPLHKIQSLLDIVLPTYSAVFAPNQNLNIEDSTLFVNGKRPALSRKEVKLQDVKVFSITDSKTSYTLDMFICTGKQFISAERQLVDMDRFGEEIIMKLSQPYMYKGHIIYITDRLCTSPLLCHKLLMDYDTGLVGACSSSKREYPEVLNERKLRQMRREEPYYARCGNMVCAAWFDSKYVSLVSSVHTSCSSNKRMKSTTAEKGFHEVKTPTFVDLYRSHMEGKDKLKKSLGSYSYPYKSVKWCKAIFHHLLDMALVNGYILYCQTATNPKLAIDFRHDVINVLITPTMKFRKRSPIQMGKQLGQGADVSRLSAAEGNHFPDQFKDKKCRPRCKVCSAVKIRSSTSYFCAGCEDNPPLCIIPCFSIFHTHEDYAPARLKFKKGQQNCD